MIDLHSHILARIDDGAQSLEDSVEIAQAAVRDGTKIIAATPHVRDDFPTTAQTIGMSVRELNAILVDRGIELAVIPGAEVALSRLLSLSDEELRRFTFAGKTRYLLLEFPYFGWPLALQSEIWRLRNDGLTPVLAHPERNYDVQARPERIAELIEVGALVQLTAASVDGRLGRAASACSIALINAGHAHIIASDAHQPGVRAVGLSAAAARLGNPELARWLTNDVPAAIIADDPIPVRPYGEARAPKRRRFFFRGKVG